MTEKTEDFIFKPIDPIINPNLFGHKSNEQLFLSSIKSDHCHHAWLLSGIKGIGKFTFACRVARFIFSTIPDVQNEPMRFWNVQKSTNNFTDGFNFDDSNNENIDEQSFIDTKVTSNFISRKNIDTLQIDNNDIFNKIKLGTFSDLKIISPDIANNKKEIAIDDIRKIYDFFHVSSSMHDYRIIIIDSIDDLNNNSANALLKILEEPPKKTIFFLICHNINNILDTIKSRTRILNFSPLKDELVERLLYDNITNINNNLVQNLVYLSSGSIGTAYDLYNADVNSIINDMKLILTDLLNWKVKNLINFASGLQRGYKFYAFKKLILAIINSVVKFNMGVLDIKSLNLNIQEIINIVSSCYNKNVESVIKLKADIENMFYKHDEINLDSESVIILILNMLLRRY